MLPVIAIIGRPNVGKSTLFNCLTKSRDALVADLPGLTRDRQYGEAFIGERPFIVIDTGGIGFDAEGLDNLMLEQTHQAVEEADVILFVVDGRSGLTTADEAIAGQLRGAKKNIYLVVNKTDGLDPDIAMVEFHAMGIANPIPIAAAHKRNISGLMSKVLQDLPEPEIATAEEAAAKGIQVAIIGRPNVGKSTLVNRILGEDRVVVYDQAGTTRDSIFIPFNRQGQDYTIIDTAGMRRRSKVTETVEKFSIIKTLQAIESANVVVYIADAREGIVEHDLRLLGFVLDTGKALVIAINKWDGLEESQKQHVKRELERRLRFIDFADIHFISALHGTGVGHLFKSITTAYASALKKFNTNIVSKILEKALENYQPPLVKGHRIKLRYAHMGGHNPPTIIIHGNQTNAIPASYKRYLAKFFRKAMELKGTPVRLQFKTGENPFKGRKNVLTDRQKQKRKRMKKHLQKK